MTTEDENNMTPTTIRKPLAHNVFDMLTAHAELYHNVITIAKVQQDIYATFGVRRGRSAVVELLRDVAAKGLIIRNDLKGRAWYLFHSTPTVEMMDAAEGHIRYYIAKTAEPVRERSLLKARHSSREVSESLKAFIQASKEKDCELLFNKDAVIKFLRLNGMTVLSGKRIVKAIGNMIAHESGVVKTDLKAVYCVPADETRFDKFEEPSPLNAERLRLFRLAQFDKSAVQSKEFEVRRPDVVTPDNAQQTATQNPIDKDLAQVCQAVAAVVIAFRAVSRLSGLRNLSDFVGTFKE